MTNQFSPTHTQELFQNKKLRNLFYSNRVTPIGKLINIHYLTTEKQKDGDAGDVQKLGKIENILWQNC